MTILNITYGGVSADYPLDTNLPVSDADVRRLAVEVLRAGGVRGLSFPDIGDRAFEHYVVDRFTGARGEARIYLRPKVPFGAAAAR
jgi:hypothetical protein